MRQHLFKIYFLALFLGISLSTYAQSVVIGTGTVTTAGTGSDPIDGYYNELRYQVVYTSSELSGGGMSNGSTITALGWDVSEAFGGGALPNYTIKIGHTTAVNAIAHITAPLTTVKNPFSFTPVVQTPGSFQMITFDSPFIWDGTSNIVVDICAGFMPYIAPYGGVRATAMTNGARFIRCDGCGSQCANTTNSLLTNRPNVKLDYAAGTACSGTPAPGIASGPTNVCPNVPFNINVTGVSTGTGMVYEWKSSPTGLNTWSPVAGGNSPSLSVNGGQTATTDYHLVVTCTNGGLMDSTNNVTVGVNSFLGCYCIPTNAGTAQITNVTIVGTTFNNTSGAATAPTYYNAFPPTGGATGTLTQGTLYTITATFDAIAISSIWIDYNQNGLFEASEWTQIGTTGAAHSASFTVPLTALPGQTGMRVRSRGQGNQNGAADACLAMGGGETEDYIITIAQAIACSGTPNAAVASGPATACLNAPFTLTTTNITTGLNLTYQWQLYNTATSTWDPIPTATNPSYTVTVGQATATDYRFVTICANGGGTSTSNIVTVGMSSFYMCYCSPITGTVLHTTQLNYITNVTITGTTLNNTSTTVGAGGYTQYSPSVPSNTATLDQGLLYTIQVTHPFTGYFAGVWLDWDQNGTMDVSEFVPMTTVGTLSTGTFFVPLTSTPGMTGLRVRQSTAAMTSGQPCTNIGYETEDYAVTVVQAIGCTGTPNAATISGPSGACQATPFTMNASGYTTGIGITFEWQFFNTGTSTWDPLPPTNGNPTYTVANQTTSTNYRFVTVCANGGGTSQSNVLIVTQNPATQCYCTPTYNTGGGGDVVVNVQLGTLNNNSTALGNPPTHYTDYTSQQPGTIPIPDLTQGLTSNLTLTYGTDPTQYHGVWLDFDQNGVFDTYEFFTGTPNPAGANGTAVVAIAVPITATVGNVRMRIRGGDDQAVTSAQACAFSTSTNYGEAEDYLVNILATSNCTGQPAIAAASGPSSACAGSAFTLSATGATTGVGIVYSWEYFDPNTSAWTPTGGANTTYNVTGGITATTQYRFVTTCTNGGLQGISNTVTVTATTSSAVPLFEGFNTSATNAFPGCWTQQFVTGTNNLTFQTATTNPATVPYEGTRFVWWNSYSFSTNSSTRLVSPTLTTIGTPGVDVNFYWYNENSNLYNAGAYITNEGVQVQYSFDAISWVDAGSFIPRYDATLTAGTGQWALKTITLPAAAGNVPTLFVGFKFVSNFGDNCSMDAANLVSTPLAIDIKSIGALNVGHKNRIDWSTADEEDGDKFEVERSTDGDNFTAIGAVNAKGASANYTYWDQAPVAGINYYRVKVNSISGSSIYSRVVTATVKGEGAFTVEAYPNPVSDLLTVRVYGTTAANPSVSVSDVTGKVVKLVPVANNEAIISMAGLAQGLYLVKYTDNDRSQTIKVNKR